MVEIKFGPLYVRKMTTLAPLIGGILSTEPSGLLGGYIEQLVASLCV